MRHETALDNSLISSPGQMPVVSRRNIFTSYIICNRLNFEVLFEPIIDFIEISKPRGPPSRAVYENFISYSSNKNTQVLAETDME